MPALRFDHLYRYEELRDALHALAAEYPSLLSLDVIGSSHEGREVFLTTVTNAATGPHDTKPAVWVDANIHATEITGSTAALHLLHRLVTGHGNDERVTRAVDTRAFYVVPRVNPDGVELALAAKPTYLRSSTRKWPRTDDADGLVNEDIDGDGRILTMRVPDPNGSWKVSDADARLLVPRRPDDPVDGTYYRLLPEGTIRNYDGVLITNAPERRSLDLNRNFPAGWRTEGEQQGAGPYPASETEVRTLVDALTARRNVCAYFAYHTYSAVNLRPYDDRPDDKMPIGDLTRYKQLGAWGKEITGYDAVSVYHDFRYGRDEVITGAADTWAYDHLGIVGWTTEFWSPLRAAGLTGFHLVEWYEQHPVEDDLALLRWNDETLGGRGFVEWYPFEHPQLGRVELGGWDFFHMWSNPPLELMEAEIAPHADFAVLHALSTPLLALHSVDVSTTGDVHRIRAVVHNTGWMPTNVTDKAIERKAVRALEATITLPAGASLVQGKDRVELGQLAGWSRARTMLSWDDSTDDTRDRAKVEWVVRAPAGTVVTIDFRHERAGTVHTEVTL